VSTTSEIAAFNVKVEKILPERWKDGPVEARVSWVAWENDRYEAVIPVTKGVKKGDTLSIVVYAKIRS
jgi:hypothetical protein